MTEKENTKTSEIQNDILENYGELFTQESIAFSNSTNTPLDFYLENRTSSTNIEDTRLILTPSGAAEVLSLNNSNIWSLESNDESCNYILIMIEVCILDNRDKFPCKAFSVENIQLGDKHFFLKMIPYTNPRSVELLKKNLDERVSN